MKSSSAQRWICFILAGAILGLTVVPNTLTAQRPSEAEAARFLSSYENVRFSAGDGTQLAGWFVPCANAKRAAVLLHGNGSRRTQMLARARLLHDNGFAVLLYDARGHGDSEDKHVSYGWFESSDLLGAVDWLRNRGFIDFGCLGASQGGATIVFAAQHLKDVRWVVLESVYPTLQTAVDRRFRHSAGSFGWLAGRSVMPLAEWWAGIGFDKISPIDHIADLHCPILVMSGEQDPYTLPADTKALFEHALEPKSLWLVPGAAHVDLYGFAKQDYERHLLSFIASAH